MTAAAPKAPVASTTLDLIERSRESLLAACLTGNVAERYVHAHLGALRAAAALLAARGRPNRRRTALRSVWEVLPTVAPELGEWAVFFAATGRRRLVVERGDAVPATREADDLLRAGETFLGLVLAALGVPMSCTLPDFAVATGRAAPP